MVTLARAESHTFTYNDRNNASTIDIGAKQYTIDPNSTAQQVVDLVNADTTSTVYATLVNGDINFTAKTSGAASSFTVSGQTLTNDVEKIGLDAEIKVDGGASQFSANNVFANAIPGLEITAKSVATGLTVTVGAPGPDMAAMKSKVKAFVEQYNSTVDFVKSKLNEKRVVDPQDRRRRAQGRAEGRHRPLRPPQPAPHRAHRRRRPATLPRSTSCPSSAFRPAASVGSGAINLSAVGGKLLFDEAKFDAAVASDPTSVRTMLGGMAGTDGFGQRLEAMLEPVGAGRRLDREPIRSMDDEKKRITDSIAAHGEAPRLQGGAHEGDVRRHGVGDGRESAAGTVARRPDRRPQQQPPLSPGGARPRT